MAEYQARNISVGAVNIDSEWSTGINNFIFDEQKYPNASAMIEVLGDICINKCVWVWVCIYMSTRVSGKRKSLHCLRPRSGLS